MVKYHNCTFKAESSYNNIRIHKNGFIHVHCVSLQAVVYMSESLFKKPKVNCVGHKVQKTTYSYKILSRHDIICYRHSEYCLSAASILVCMAKIAKFLQCVQFEQRTQNVLATGA